MKSKPACRSLLGACTLLVLTSFSCNAMLKWLSNFSGHLHCLNLFRYISFRCLGALLLGFAFVVMLTPRWRTWILTKGVQPIRLDGPQSHLETKKGKATMGGVVILGALGLNALLWANPFNPYVGIVLLVTFGFGAIGAWDDFLKIRHANPSGLTAKQKFIAQWVMALLVMGILPFMEPSALSGRLFFPFFRKIILVMPIVYIFFGAFVMVGSSNAVNLTDGLDGLAIGALCVSFFVFMIMAYVSSHGIYAAYLHLNFIHNASDLAILCASLLGGGLGFLWHNAPPSSIIMGDVGALAFGGFLGIISVLLKQEILFLLIGGLFVFETLSVMVQVYVFRKKGRRFFLMAPLHHHYEKKGWSESTIVIRFWIIAFLLGILALSSLKLR